MDFQENNHAGHSAVRQPTSRPGHFLSEGVAMPISPGVLLGAERDAALAKAAIQTFAAAGPTDLRQLQAERARAITDSAGRVYYMDQNDRVFSAALGDNRSMLDRAIDKVKSLLTGEPVAETRQQIDAYAELKAVASYVAQAPVVPVHAPAQEQPAKSIELQAKEVRAAELLHIAERYIQQPEAARGATTIIVKEPADREVVVEHVRTQLRAAGVLRGEDFLRYQEADRGLFQAEKSSAVSYRDGDIVAFSAAQNEQIKAGDRVRVTSIDPDANLVHGYNERTMKVVSINLNAKRDFDDTAVIENKTLSFAVGDKVKTLIVGDGDRLQRGEVVSVDKENMRIRMETGKSKGLIVEIDKHANVRHAYAAGAAQKADKIVPEHKQTFSNRPARTAIGR